MESALDGEDVLTRLLSCRTGTRPLTVLCQYHIVGVELPFAVLRVPADLPMTRNIRRFGGLRGFGRLRRFGKRCSLKAFGLGDANESGGLSAHIHVGDGLPVVSLTGYLNAESFLQKVCEIWNTQDVSSVIWRKSGVMKKDVLLTQHPLSPFCACASTIPTTGVETYITEHLLELFRCKQSAMLTFITAIPQVGQYLIPHQIHPLICLKKREAPPVSPNPTTPLARLDDVSVPKIEQA